MKPSYFSLSNAFALKAYGAHAARYLQARTTQDIHSIQPGKSALGATLSPQGKLEVLFRAFCVTSPTEFILIIDGEGKKEALDSILRFKVADQIEISEIENIQVLHLAGSSEEFFKDLPVQFAIPTKRIREPGLDLVYKTEDGEKLLSLLEEKATLLSDEQYANERILAEIPQFGIDIKSGSLFLEANLSTALCQTKGCYAGQEIIEKTLARGRTPKILLPCEIESQNVTSGLVITTKVDNTPKVAGEVVTVGVASGKTQRAFVRLRSQYLTAQLLTEQEELVTLL